MRFNQTFRQPYLFTITVDAFRSYRDDAAVHAQQNASQWRLPAPDLRNEGKYMYRVNNVDLYFWTTDDANLFLDSLKRVVQPHQLQLVSAQQSVAHAEHKTEAMNPVVQKLEQVAISKPYQSRSASVRTTQSAVSPSASTSAPAGSAHTSPLSQETTPNYAPLAYNPAAPAAPEPIVHREETPPPIAAAEGTGVEAVVTSEHAPRAYQGPPSNSFAPQSTAAQSYMPGPPSAMAHRAGTVSSFPPPPPAATTAAYSPAFAPPPQASSPAQPAPYDANVAPYQPGIQRHATAPVISQHANYHGSPAHTPAAMYTGLPVSLGYAPTVYHPAQQYGVPLAAGHPQYPYGTPSPAPVTAGAVPPSADPYAAHTHVYRPTELEAAVQTTDGANPNAPPKTGKLEQRADRLEKGVGKFLKKLDKKF